MRRKWEPPEEGTFKVNVDASFFPGAAAISVGMVLRDHTGKFIKGRTHAFTCPLSVLEVESIG